MFGNSGLGLVSVVMSPYGNDAFCIRWFREISSMAHMFQKDEVTGSVSFWSCHKH